MTSAILAPKPAPVRTLSTRDLQDGLRLPTAEERNAMYTLRPLSAWDEKHIDLCAQYEAANDEYFHAIDVDDRAAESHWLSVMDALNVALDELEDNWGVA